MTATLMKLETVKLSACKVGDVIATHGGLFRLTVEHIERHAAIEGVNSDASRIDYANGLRCFSTEWVGLVDESRPCDIPAHWIHRPGGWHIQSNDRAVWARVVDGATPSTGGR